MSRSILKQILYLLPTSFMAIYGLELTDLITQTVGVWEPEEMPSWVIALATQAKGPGCEYLVLSSKARHSCSCHSCNPSTVMAEAGGSLELTDFQVAPGSSRAPISGTRVKSDRVRPVMSSQSHTHTCTSVYMCTHHTCIDHTRTH